MARVQAARRPRGPRWSARRRRADERGTVLVEFAFVLPLLLVLVLGMMDFGTAFNYWIQETHLSNEAARFAVVSRNPCADSTPAPPAAECPNGAGTSLGDYIKKQIPDNMTELRNGITIEIATATAGNPLTVKACYQYSWLPFLSGWIGFNPTMQLKGTATMRAERVDSTPPVGTGTCP